jgi:hypothetical protein
MNDTAEAPQSMGTVADEIIAQALEQNAANATQAEPQTAPPAQGKRVPAGYEDPLDEALFSDEALRDPKVLQERAGLLRAQIKEAMKIRQAAHNARAEVERREAKFKGTKQEVLSQRATLQQQQQLMSALVSDISSGDPGKFTDAIAKLTGSTDPHEYWRKVATHLATGKPPTREVPAEVLELKREIEALKAQKQAEVEQQSEAEIDQRIYQARVQQLETAKSYTDLQYVPNIAAENPELVDARLTAIRTEHYNRTGQSLDLRAACDIVEGEIRSHFELLQRAGGASGQPNGARGAAAPVAGQAGNPERFAKPVTAPSAPSQQSTPRTLPSSLSSEPAATNRSLSDAEQKAAAIEAFERMGLFANFGM